MGWMAVPVGTIFHLADRSEIFILTVFLVECNPLLQGDRVQSVPKTSPWRTCPSGGKRADAPYKKWKPMTDRDRQLSAIRIYSHQGLDIGMLV